MIGLGIKAAAKGAKAYKKYKKSKKKIAGTPKKKFTKTKEAAKVAAATAGAGGAVVAANKVGLERRKKALARKYKKKD